MAWDTMTWIGLTLPIVLAGVISGFLCLDRATQGVATGDTGAKRDDLGASPSRAQTPSRPAGFEEGNSS